MKIETKFYIGQRVYIIFKEENDPYVKIFDDVITQIVIEKDKILYYGYKICEEFEEEDIVDIDHVGEVLQKIEKLLEVK